MWARVIAGCRRGSPGIAGNGMGGDVKQEETLSGLVQATAEARSGRRVALLYGQKNTPQT
jgi:hypothetical protein